MRFADEGDAITYIFESMRRLDPRPAGADEVTRTTAPTRELLAAAGLLAAPREYAVITGSKGKGSTTAITAKILEHLGHTVGMITSPHLVSYRERIRVNGRAIPETDLVRITRDLAPAIDAITARLHDRQYFSPQGLFLAIALRWFDEQGVKAAVLEVGRGGRYDDIALVPNRVSLFTPILMEHVNQLGPTLDRIAWHKAGIIKPNSYAYSVPQAPSVLDVLETEASTHGAQFAWIAPGDQGEYQGSVMIDGQPGMRFTLGRYGDLDLALAGRYQQENAALAIQGAGNVHGRLIGIPHGSPAYVDRVRAALRAVRWPGRVQKLADAPAIYIDGATSVIAARSFMHSIENEITRPLVAIIATPIDRDYRGVYEYFGDRCDAVILTENNISPNVRFPDASLAIATARQFNEEVAYASGLPGALDLARAKAGRGGTIVMPVTLPVVGEAMQLWGFEFEQI